MKIAILGTGAMGTLFGSKITKAGEDVTLLYRRKDAVDKINRNGVLIESLEGTVQNSVSAMLAQDLHETPDAVFLFTKAMQTENALASIKPYIGTNTYLVSLQNGLCGFDQLKQYTDPEHIILGVTNYPSDLIEDGHIVSKGNGYVKIARSDQRSDPMVEQLSEIMVRSGFASQVEPNIFVAIWEKAAFNIALNTTTAICRATCGMIGNSPDGRNLSYRLADEVIGVSHALGIQVSENSIKNLINTTFSVHKDHYSSMAQDIISHRKTEAAALHGYVIKKADLLQIPVPTIKTTYLLIRILESIESQ